MDIWVSKNVILREKIVFKVNYVLIFATYD